MRNIFLGLALTVAITALPSSNGQEAETLYTTTSYNLELDFSAFGDIIDTRDYNLELDFSAFGNIIDTRDY